MQIKRYLFAGLLTAAVAGHAVAAVPSLQGDSSQDVIILAQDDSSGSFWGNIFNRPGKKSGAQPLYLNTPGLAPGGQGKPYDASRNQWQGHQSGNSAEDEWEAFKKARHDAILTRHEQLMAKAKHDNEIAAAELEARIKEHNRAAHGGSAAETKTKKKMVYDPQSRMRIYVPGKKQSDSDSDTQPHKPLIYNRR